ncbi:alpha/beta fold hydrolase [Amycolatopsis sp. NPDC005232]|uniref:thioesterase II family protein n=1 Tax=Amycolatopsis sp. NPDC005232 TaxID=3157027 RepID=UPI0033A9E776
MTTTSLVCVPFAGAGASLFRQWREHAGDRLSLVPVQLPGREEQFLDPPLTTMAEVVDVVAAKAAEAAAGGPFVLFGHSFGALAAYETAQALVTRALPLPRRLLVSGIASPWAPRVRLGTAALSDDEFVSRLADLVGYRHAALADPDLREVVLPALRADMTIADEYEPSSRLPLPVPITVLRGEHDELVSAADAAGWAEVGGSGVDFVALPGAHMYFTENPGDLIAELDRCVRAPVDVS